MIQSLYYLIFELIDQESGKWRTIHKQLSTTPTTNFDIILEFKSANLINFHFLKEKSIVNFYTLILIILITTILPKEAISSPTCSVEEIEKELTALGLDFDIYDNDDLLTNLEYKYGKSLVEHLSEKHPHLKNSPDAPVDGKTLKWIQEAIWSTNHNYARHKLLPIPHFNEEAWDYVMAYLIQDFKDKKNRYTYVFVNDETKDKFIEFVENDEKMIAWILTSYPNATPTAVDRLLGDFRKYFIANKSYSVGFSSLAGQKTPVIQIMGHGRPTLPGISMGDVTVSVDEMAELVKSLDIPKDASIKMNICFSGCKKYAMKYPVEKIKDMFLSGDLKELYDAGSKSLIDLFSESLFNKMPEFEGKVQGYLGIVLSGKRKDALNMDNILTRAYAVRVQGTNGVIHLKRSDASLTIERKDYAPKFGTSST